MHFDLFPKKSENKFFFYPSLFTHSGHSQMTFVTTRGFFANFIPFLLSHIQNIIFIAFLYLPIQTSRLSVIFE